MAAHCVYLIESARAGHTRLVLFSHLSWLVPFSFAFQDNCAIKLQSMLVAFNTGKKKKCTFNWNTKVLYTLLIFF